MRIFMRIIGVLGEVMITAGLLLILFLTWQMWWTDVVANRAQSDIVEQLGWAEPPDVEAPSAARRTDAPPVETMPTENAEVFAKLYIPGWGKNYVKPIARGIDRATVLNTVGVGWYPQTQSPGELGNFAIAGHRTTHGKPFNRIEELKEGSAVVIRTEKNWYVYRAKSSLVVIPSQIGVLSPVPTSEKFMDPPPEKLTKRIITLTSCHPIYWPVNRYVVHGELEYWMPVSSGIPAEVLGMKGL